MKRGGLFFAAFLLIGGMLRLTSPGTSAPSPQETKAQSKAKTEKTDSALPKIPYLEKFARTINDFYGLAQGTSASETDPASYFEQLHKSAEVSTQGPVQFVVAILPDPVHTRLGLFFDRTAEALQQAAQMQHYVFDRAIMPWDRTAPPEASDLKTRREERQEQAQRESYPGLMIFRPGEDSQSKSSDSPAKGPLFVLVVGETPTAGLNRRQFRNAIQMIQAIRGTANAPDAGKQPLLILGPSFSGSLESLSAELAEPEVNAISKQKFIYSGTVTGTSSMNLFQQRLEEQTRQQAGASSQFASFQENDDFVRNQFLQFACSRGYFPYEVAVLSEDETVFGGSGARTHTAAAEPMQPATAAKSCEMQSDSAHDAGGGVSLDQNILKLHFPREISYFRSAYQKEIASSAPTSSNSSSLSTLPLDLEETGSDDDTVAPYAVPQTSLSQEAVMLGIVSELQKHHIKFTLLLASDPLDELFLATYLRKAYSQGRVVVTAPDLLFARTGDPALGGVLGLSSYSLIPGLSDRLCRQGESIAWHEDRLFVSSLSEGTFNAMVGLLAVQNEQLNGWRPGSGSSGRLPYAPYAEYGSPNLKLNPPSLKLSSPSASGDPCEERPLLWLSILGRDGFWAIAGLSLKDRNLQSADGQIPMAPLDSDGQHFSSLYSATDSHSAPSYSLLSLHNPWETKLRTPPAWNIAYCLCLVLLIVHAIFSWTGSILADSEDRAQFTRTTDCRGAIILGLGAFVLASAFVLAMCTRSPGVEWAGFPGLTLLLWSPYPLFVIVTYWDLARLRAQRTVAYIFLGAVCAMTVFQLALTWTSYKSLKVYWSTRLLHITSGVSPVLPVFLLMAAAYWWMWMSLRGVCLVDLRRPRLPLKKDLPHESFRISDTEGEDLRKTAHPLYFLWQIAIPVLGLSVVSLLALGRDFSVQSVEGIAFDIGYTVILCLAVAAFLGCLMKLVMTWQKCHQVLAGLDRFPLREAFSRMKGLSWHSFWNPGGSTLRETYKIMNHAMENLRRLLEVVENWNTPMKESARYWARDQIRKTLAVQQEAFKIYSRILAREKKKISRRYPWHKKILVWLRKDAGKGERLHKLMKSVELLQKEMARTGAIMLTGLLKPLWEEEESPVVSTDDRIKKPDLPVYRAMAEEYVALVYVNFLVSVLLRIRTLVIAAGGMYVFIVLSMNTYPFEPHLALQTLAVVLLLVMGAAIGFVYAEMHRETILSRLTSTQPGELGLDFWIKFASAAAIPVFSLLAAQFPGINQFLFSWLEPALQAMK